MKKLLLATAVVLFVGSLLISCKSHERCPAYGDVTPPESQVEKSV